MSAISVCIAIITVFVHCETVYLPSDNFRTVSHVNYASSVTDTFFLTRNDQPPGASGPRSSVTADATTRSTKRKNRPRGKKSDSGGKIHLGNSSSLPHDLETSGSEMLHFMPRHEDHHYHHCHHPEPHREMHGCCHRPSVASVNLMLPHMPYHQQQPMMMMVMPTMAPTMMPGMMNPMNPVGMMTQRLFWMAMG
jgi:hypothetical protein